MEGKEMNYTCGFADVNNKHCIPRGQIKCVVCNWEEK